MFFYPVLLHRLFEVLVVVVIGAVETVLCTFYVLMMMGVEIKLEVDAAGA